MSLIVPWALLCASGSEAKFFATVELQHVWRVASDLVSKSDQDYKIARHIIPLGWPGLFDALKKK
jgi:hypothetical protein